MKRGIFTYSDGREPQEFYYVEKLGGYLISPTNDESKLTFIDRFRIQLVNDLPG